MKLKYRLLSIETSCDETAAAVIEFNAKLDTVTTLSSVVASQISLHKKFGGVYPEMASRAHSQKILLVVTEALQRAGITNYELRIKECHCEAGRSNLTHQSHPEPVEGSGPRLPRSQEVARNDNLILNTNNNLSPLTLNNIDAIAVTTGPGLVGSLIVGVEFARGLSAATGIPVVPVNHLEGHIYANFVGENYSDAPTGTSGVGIPTSADRRDKFQIAEEKNLNSNTQTLNPEFPALALVVSGGHTLLVLMRKHLDYEVIGSTLDDAAGECFDKVARMLNLPYPGGPALEKLAKSGNPKAFDFPRSMSHSNDYNFSFSGLKTAVFYKLRSLGLVNGNAEPILKSKILNLKSIKADIAASFQQAVIDVLVAKTLKASEELKVKSILVGGGVISNSSLRATFILKSKILNLKSYLSPKELATDNALSIAVAGAYHFTRGDTIPWQKLDATASLRL